MPTAQSFADEQCWMTRLMRGNLYAPISSRVCITLRRTEKRRLSQVLWTAVIRREQLRVGRLAGLHVGGRTINCTAPILTTSITGAPNYTCMTTNTPHFGSTGYALQSMGHAWEDGPNFCNFEYLGGVSPIVIDRNGDHFQSNFTGIDDGIVWDFFGRLDGPNGQSTPDSKIHMAWTRPNATVGFLWIDRNTNEDRTACFMASSPKGCNGTPDNGKELFGNISPQQPPPGVKTSFTARLQDEWRRCVADV